MDADVIKSLKKRPSAFLRLAGFEKRSPAYDVWMRKMVFGKDDWTLQAFRGAGKTTCVSGSLALIAILMPNLKAVFMRKTDTDTKEIIAQTRRMLESEAAWIISREVWGVPVRLTTSSQLELNTNLTNDPRGTAQLLGMGVNGSLTGKHFDLVFADDIVNRKDRTSRAERENTKNVYRELQNVKNRGGRIIVSGTPWHVDDCFSLMPQAEKWDWRSMPEVITEEEAAYLKERMTPSLWAANYELRHIASDDVIFTEPKTGAEPEHMYHAECHVDAAYYGEDYTAFSAAIEHDGKVYVYGRMWRKNILDVADEIKADHTRLMLGRLYIENNTDKGYAANVLKGKGIPIVSYPETQNKHVKIVTHLKKAWPDIVFCKGTDKAYVDQICDYTEDAEHDDAPDSLASLLMRGKISARSAAASLYR